MFKVSVDLHPLPCSARLALPRLLPSTLTVSATYNDKTITLGCSQPSALTCLVKTCLV